MVVQPESAGEQDEIEAEEKDDRPGADEQEHGYVDQAHDAGDQQENLEPFRSEGAVRGQFGRKDRLVVEVLRGVAFDHNP